MDYYFDTAKMREYSKELKYLIDTLESYYNLFFDKLRDMPTISKEWTGQSATLYSSAANLDKKSYNNYIDALRSYSKHLDEVADLIDSKKERMIK